MAYHTYVCQSDGLICRECKGSIPKGEEFAVVSTPSKPHQENCLACTDIRIAAEEKHLKVEGTPSTKVKSGGKRA